MTVLEFVEKYKNTTSEKIRENMIENRIKRYYSPVLEKRWVLQAMLDKSIITKENGFKYIDMVASRINYTMALVALYTDLEIDRDDDKGLLVECYDALIEADLISKFCELVGEKEMGELATINAALFENFSNETSINATISEAISIAGQKFAIITGTAIEYLDEMFKEENLKNFINK